MSLREECPLIKENTVFEAIIQQLREDFLFIALDDFIIEVHEQDIEPIRKQLQSLSVTADVDRQV